jgi:peptidoglycan/LPS O-acetylase OafA/YrhL
MVFHYGHFDHPDWIRSVGSFGWAGVDLFFVLSGYLIGGQLLSRIASQQPLPLREFYVKRAFRILPPYFVVLALYFSLPAFKESGELPASWRFLTFTQNFGLDLSKNSAFSHAWSLCVEEQFYLVVPLIILAALTFKLGKLAAWLPVGLVGLGLLLRFFSWEQFVEPMIRAGQSGWWVQYFEWIYYPSYTRMDGLTAGVTLAGLVHSRPLLWRSLNRHGNLWALLGLGILGGSYLLCFELMTFGASVFGFPLIALGFAFLVLSALSPGSVLASLQSRFTSWVAAISYSLYLIHKPLMHLTQLWMAAHGFEADSNVVLLCAMLVSLLGGWLLHLLVERPALRLREVLLQRYPPAKGRLQPP